MPRRAGATFGGEGGIGRDRFDPEQREQPLEGRIEIRIDARKDGVKLRHDVLIPCCPAAAYVRSASCSPSGSLSFSGVEKGSCGISPGL